MYFLKNESSQSITVNGRGYRAIFTNYFEQETNKMLIEAISETVP